MKDEKFYDKKGKIKGSGIVTSRDEKRKGIDNSVDMSKMNRQNSYDAYKEDVDLEEGKITKWLTAPIRKKALAQKMRQHSINILTKNNSYKKAGDVSGEDATFKDPTGHGRSFLNKGYKETGEKSFSKSSKIAYPDSDKHNRPVINNGPKSTAMRKKLTTKYSAKGQKAVDHSQKWWKKADKLNPLEEAKNDDPPFTPDKKKTTPWTSPRRKAKQLARNMMKKFRDAVKKKTKTVSENLKPSQKAVKYLINKEVKKNSSASGDDFQPTKRSSKLLAKLKEGSIKDLVTKDQEEKRLLKTDEPQKVLTDKERAKLKALKKWKNKE